MSHSTHNWSGWPGAWCLDCGIDDPIEMACADDTCWLKDEHGNDVVDPETGNPMLKPIDVPPCPEPGSNRHNPYTRQS